MTVILVKVVSKVTSSSVVLLQLIMQKCRFPSLD